MPQFPLKCEVSSEATEGISSTWNAQEGSLPPIVCSIPAEFNGSGEGYSPEALFGMATLNCIIAMFKGSTERFKAHFEKLMGKVNITLDCDSVSHQLFISGLEITFDIIGASDSEQIKKLLETAIKECPISNSIKSGKTFHINIS